MAGMRIPPSAATQAGPEPEMAAKSMAATMVVAPRPPVASPTIAVMSPKQIARIHSSMWLYHGDFVFVFIWSDSILPPPKRPVLFTAAGAAYGMRCGNEDVLK